MKYRKLQSSEINILEKQGCSAEIWDTVSVVESFMTGNIKNVRFSGEVKLGLYDQTLEIYPGISKPSGIYNAYIQNCHIGSNVYICDVKNLANYTIADKAVIENVSLLMVSGSTTFSNGSKIEILNEGGGRELMIYDQLSSQVAYLMVTRRDDEQFIQKLENMIHEYVESATSDRGYIGNHTRIVNCLTIQNVNIGDYANIDGALQLEEGTISSNENAPAIVGQGVIAKTFIILSGSKVDGGATLDHTFVGQGVKIGKQYSAENSAFFANCEGFHGEACSIFAGPYTVTHHKSTLLIAGLFSFYNAGSGSNQSNHMYKLGPVHQGILERGSKTGSFSYMMWPARVGAFSGVIGKHYANFDSSDFPFSYILESKGKSLLMPAMNLCTVGTRRDSAKWPNRDRRTDLNKLDLINFDLFNPYTIGKILSGIELLNNLMKENGSDQEFIQYHDLFIKRSKLPDAIDKYEMAVKIYMGDVIINKLEKIDADLILEQIVSSLKLPQSESLEEYQLDMWVDISGMITASKQIEDLLELIKNDSVSSLEELTNYLQIIFKNYEKHSWSWCCTLIKKIYHLNGNHLSSGELINIIEEWRNNKVKMNELILQDAKKEFSDKSQIGFGIDGDADMRKKDFKAVRGNFEQNKFVAELNAEIDKVKSKANSLISMLKTTN